jgi:hypothetical protein
MVPQTHPNKVCSSQVIQTKFPPQLHLKKAQARHVSYEKHQNEKTYTRSNLHQLLTYHR